MVDQRTMDDAPTPVTVERDEGSYSAFWPARATAGEFVDALDDSTVDGPAILYTDETPENAEIPYEEVQERLSEETPRFLRVHTDDYAMTWEDHPDVGETGIADHVLGDRLPVRYRTPQRLVGFVAEDRDLDAIGDLYEATTGDELSIRDRTKLAALIR